MELECLQRKAEPLIALAREIGCKEIFSNINFPNKYSLTTFVDFLYIDPLDSPAETIFFGLDGNKLCGPVGCGSRGIASNVNALGSLPVDIEYLLPKMVARSYYCVYAWDGEKNKGGRLQWREVRSRLDHTIKPPMLIVSARRSVTNFYGKGDTIAFKTGDLFSPDYYKCIPDPVGKWDELQEAINQAYAEVR